ncbi:MAG: hypothetical protein JWM86_139 [Thermoleophilia bacterium]|nr:hypothetical protein [Thermoleophilia bacterium]
MDVLDLRKLNRATLARQGLLERSREDVAAVVKRAGGIQAQGPSQAMIGLWSRIEGFRRAQLVEAAVAGKVVRGTTMHGTLHLHEVDDYRAVRPAIQPLLDSVARSLARRYDADALDEALQLGRELLERQPMPIGALKRALKERCRDIDPQALGNFVRHAVPLLIVPDPEVPNGWRSNVAPFTPATALIGGRLAAGPNPALLVRRFFESLGPGTVADAQAWSGISGLKASVTSMVDAGELIEVATFEGATMFDLPHAPRPDGDIPAGVRYLPMWDNLLLSHRDRSRVVDPAFKPYIASRNGMPPPTYLVDGFVHGLWTCARSGDVATLQLAPFAPIPAWAQEPLVREGEALLGFLEPGAGTRVVRLG